MLKNVFCFRHSKKGKKIPQQSIGLIQPVVAGKQNAFYLYRVHETLQQLFLVREVSITHR